MSCNDDRSLGVRSPSPRGRPAEAARHRRAWCIGLAASALTLTPDAARAQEILDTITLPTPNEGAAALADVFDVDGDGKRDLLVGLPAAASDAGRIALYPSGDPTGQPLWIRDGAVAGGRLGTSVVGLPDVDGDGVPDVAAGAPGDGGCGCAGRVEILSGATGATLKTLWGAAIGDRFGTSLDALHDVDGDGLADLMIGAPGSDLGGVDAGRADVFSSAPGTPGVPLFGVLGETAGTELGNTLSASWWWTADTPPEPVLGFTSGGPLSQGSLSVHDHLSLSLVVRVDGEQGGDEFGRAVLIVGDIDGDGVYDYAGGATPDDRAGYVKIFSGATGGVLHTFAAAEIGTGFGSVLCAPGDLDGDDVPDLVVGEPDADVNGEKSGSIHVYSGATGELVETIHGTTARSRFGAAITGLGDLDGDGLADLAVAAPDTLGGSDPALVHLISFTVWDGVSNGIAGTHGIPDLNGRGSLLPETPVNITLASALENASAELVIGTDLVVDSHGVLVPTAEIVVSLTTDANGDLAYEFTWPSGVPSGTVYYFQIRVTDPAAPNGVAYSNTISATSP